MLFRSKLTSTTSSLLAKVQVSHSIEYSSGTRPRFALPTPVLPVGTVHLDDPDTGRGDVTGQAGSVAAGPLDPDQADRPEPPSHSSSRA